MGGPPIDKAELLVFLGRLQAKVRPFFFRLHPVAPRIYYPEELYGGTTLSDLRRTILQWDALAVPGRMVYMADAHLSA